MKLIVDRLREMAEQHQRKGDYRTSIALNAAADEFVEKPPYRIADQQQAFRQWFEEWVHLDSGLHPHLKSGNTAESFLSYICTRVCVQTFGDGK